MGLNGDLLAAFGDQSHPGLASLARFLIPVGFPEQYLQSAGCCQVVDGLVACQVEEFPVGKVQRVARMNEERYGQPLQNGCVDACALTSPGRDRREG